MDSCKSFLSFKVHINITKHVPICIYTNILSVGENVDATKITITLGGLNTINCEIYITKYLIA